ncbi:hypothetical protein [Chitinophaga niabensis]|uniref:Uncharacterized protein n=1 Tax=Chitinophaga niabensis TaxID=536979 RepID=A0A1N6FYE6_9BACT|nr:hypothetical protein [Chitinophaga niabensis]SIO00237.1 hypothetical protein SAMN04488055_2479 [Chitinophaga niabensis]
MGSILYDFLAESIFFHEKSMANNFKNESASRIEEEMDKYSNYTDRFAKEIIEDVNKETSLLKIYNSTNKRYLDTITQTALFLDQYIIHDPISEFLFRIEYSWGSPDSKSVLADACRFMKHITPMVAANFVKPVPWEIVYRDTNGRFSTDDKYECEVDIPADLFTWLRTKVEVRGGKLTTSGTYDYVPLASVRDPNRIEIRFDDHALTGVKYTFNFKPSPSSEIQIPPKGNTPEEARAHYMALFYYDKDDYQLWLNQAIDRAINNYATHAYRATKISSFVNANPMVTASTMGTLFSLVAEPADPIVDFTTKRMLEVNIPFFKNIDIDKLMAVRLHEANTFTTFRIELERQFKELRTITDEQQRKLKVENIMHEIGVVQVDKINRKFDHLKKQTYFNIAVGLGGLSLSIPTGGVSLIGTTIAAIKGLKDYRDHMDKVKENPSYFLWKILR